MKLGAVYPQIELEGDPGAVRHFGRALEDLGYDHLLAYDHVLGAVREGRPRALAGPYDELDPFHDPLMLFSYLAGRTERLSFACGILVLPQRQTGLVARQAADLAVLSGDRFRLGVSVGWNYVEYEALGQEYATRGARLDEQIDVLRRLWRDGVVDFEGRFHRIDRAAILPRPRAPIPIWIGGFSRRALERGARLGDGFVFGTGEAETARGWQRLQEMLRSTGRDVGGFGAESVVHATAGPAEAARRVERWRALGGTHSSIDTMGLGLESVDDHIDFLAEVREALMALP